MEMMERNVRYAVVIEWAGTNYSAYVPDLPGCVSTGRTVDETAHNIEEAVGLHLQGMQEDGDPIPEPTTVVTTISVGLPSRPAASSAERRG
jgi:predicted RNase H-like HicB family nuclease